MADARWYGEGLPGLLQSPPGQNRFNAFDLYAMGLMGYEEVKATSISSRQMQTTPRWML
jgi:hypothetical protein